MNDDARLEEIDFVDRYGPAGPPSLLRGCHHGDCEATGFVPTHTRPLNVPIESDGWYFVRCADCHGTGRCSWRTTCARIPRWFWRGVKWCWTHGPSSDMHRPEWSYWRRARLTAKVAFLYDLGMRQ